MRFSTRLLQLTALFPPILVILVGLSLLLGAREEDRVRAAFSRAEAVLGRVAELNIATRGYVRHQDERALEQWKTGYSYLGDTIDEFKYNSPEAETYIFAMRTGYESMGVIFAELERLFAGEPSESAAADSALQEPLVTRLLLASQSIASASFRHAQEVRGAATSAQQVADSITLMVCSILSIIMAGVVYVAVREEMSERRRIGEELRERDIQLSDAVIKLGRAREQMGTHEHLREIEQAAVGVVHEGRSALMPILSSAEQLLAMPDPALDRDSVRKQVTSISQAAHKVGKTIDYLDRFVVARGQACTVLDLNTTVEEALESLREECERPSWQKIRLERDLDSGKPSIYGTRTDVYEIVTKLVENAVEALPQGGTITVKTESHGDLATIEVSDTGPGMSEDVRGRSLEPFFSTKGKQSAGMGLAIVESIVRRYRGTIDIGCGPGAGTAVAVCLPMKDAKQGGQLVKQSDTEYPCGLHVLVVDDESWSRNTVKQYLAADKHTVETARNGNEGLERLRHRRFDVVITDRAMPDMSGEDLAAAVKKAHPQLPVVVVSGLSGLAGRERGLGPGIDAVLDKPVSLDNLRIVLQKTTRPRK